jgi:hypothetical protein
MQIKIVERTVSKPRSSKYGQLLTAMVESFRRDGADGKLRAIEDTGAWSPAKLRRWTSGLRFYARGHRIPGFKLSLWQCAVNGLTFRWVKAR